MPLDTAVIFKLFMNSSWMQTHKHILCCIKPYLSTQWNLYIKFLCNLSFFCFKIKQGALYEILYKTLCIKVRLGRKIRLNTTYIEGKKQILLLLLLGISITESLDRTLHVNMAWLSSDYCIQNRFNDLKRQLYFFY